MKRWVDFTNRLDDEFAWHMRGYEGGELPIDKAAQLVMSYTHEVKLTSISLTFDDVSTATWTVEATSETHVGGCGRTVLIDGSDTPPIGIARACHEEWQDERDRDAEERHERMSGRSDW